MLNWIAKYNLEVLTFITGSFLLCVVAFYPEINLIQKFILALMWVFTLHEWEEGKYPGGFIELMAGNLLQIPVTQDLANRSRIPTMTHILGFTIVPFFLSSVWWIVLLPVYLGIFEGIVHMAGVKLFKLKKFYTPGMVTALVELCIGGTCLGCLIAFYSVPWWDYLIGLTLFFACFALMQSRLTKMVGIRYREFPKIMRSRVKSLLIG